MLNIVFMGTPEFAIPSLQRLIDDKHHIKAVITAPDKPAGRGQSIQMPAVKEFALTHNINVLQPTRLKDPDFLHEYYNLEADLNIVVAFRMLPREIWNFPKLGTINLHGSILPQYRGAAPIQRAIMNGETETGLSTFFINEHIDTGAIIDSCKVPILPTDNAGSLHDRMKIAGADLLSKTVFELEQNKISSITQDEIIHNHNLILKDAPKISKDDQRLNSIQSGRIAHNYVRGLSPYPGAFFDVFYKETASTIKVYTTDFEACTNPNPNVFWETDGKTFIRIQYPDGNLYIKEIQYPGKKRLDVATFLRGFPLLTGDVRLVTP